MKYAHIVTTLSKQESVEAALYYDRMFRKWKQTDPTNLPSEGLVSEPHNEVLAMGLHDKKQYRSPFRRYAGRFSNRGPKQGRYWYTYNNEGQCTERKCKFGHFCQVCTQDSYGKINCPIAKNTYTKSKQSNKQQIITNTKTNVPTKIYCNNTNSIKHFVSIFSRI